MTLNLESPSTWSGSQHCCSHKINFLNCVCYWFIKKINKTLRIFKDDVLRGTHAMSFPKILVHGQFFRELCSRTDRTEFSNSKV